jgi:PTS system nitrogen regulatory IIA component
MDLSDLLQPGSVATDVRAATKKQLLQTMSHRAAALTGLDETTIFTALAEREKLGPTGFGLGTAIPHGKIAGLQQVTGLFARLSTPVDYGAIDGQPVDLLFLLLAPEAAGADHLKALARVSRLFRDAKLVTKLRGSTSADALYAMLATG